MRSCRRCGAVTGDIRTRHRSVHVDIKAVDMYPNPKGSQFGYTLSGRIVCGEVVNEKTRGACGVYEVYLEHRCGVR